MHEFHFHKLCGQPGATDYLPQRVWKAGTFLFSTHMAHGGQYIHVSEIEGQTFFFS